MIDNSEVHIVDLQQYTPLGGVFYFDAFHIPPQSHVVKGWEMREVHFKIIYIYISEIRKMCIKMRVCPVVRDRSPDLPLPDRAVSCSEFYLGQAG